ncbi:MAG TPA: hypothetical protein VKT78_11785, partial [Fimbriimonadaceae bacterium]|nr:hypothetical protein [Fimbriimonadaceae bacterium]
MFDALRRATQTADALGFTTTSAFDANSRRISITDPAGGIITLGYNARGDTLSQANQLNQI